LGFKACHVQSASDCVNALDVRDAILEGRANFLVAKVVEAHEGAQDGLDLGSDFFVLQDWMKVDALDVFSYLVGVCLCHDLFIF
jgi:hypothetical protein